MTTTNPTTRKALNEALRSAPGEDLDGVLEALTRVVWHKDNDGDECPPERIPTEADLVEALLGEQIHGEGVWSVSTRWIRDSEGGLDHEIRSLTYMDAASSVWKEGVWMKGVWMKGVWHQHAQLIPAGQVHDEWRSRSKPEKHPLAALVRAWQGLPLKVKANMRPDRILPTTLAMVSGKAAERDGRRTGGRLFTLAARPSEDGQLVLPGFDNPEIIGPCLPLALYDLGEGPGSTSRGAPLALRVWIEAILAVPVSWRGGPVRIEMTWRDFMRYLWPRTLPRPAIRYMALVKAAMALDSIDARIPWEFDGSGGLRRVVSMWDIPRTPEKMDDVVSIEVRLPPGSGKGPVITPNLNFYGLDNAPAYRALLNLAYVWHDPGRLRVPASKRANTWTFVKDPARYPPMTDREIIALCYPTSNQRNRRVLAQRARKVLERLATNGEIRIVDRHILPPVRTLARRDPGA